jgi:hypothetical protein
MSLNPEIHMSFQVSAEEKGETPHHYEAKPLTSSQGSGALKEPLFASASSIASPTTFQFFNFTAPTLKTEIDDDF